MRRLLNRGRVWLLTVAAAGGLLVLEGCDPTVRGTVLTGVGTAATSLSASFIKAFIESLQSQDEDSTSTVQAPAAYLPPMA